MSDIDFPGLASFVVHLGLVILGAVGLLAALILRLRRRPLAGPIATAAFTIAAAAGLLAAALEWHWLDGRQADRQLPLMVAGVLLSGFAAFVLVRRSAAR